MGITMKTGQVSVRGKRLGRTVLAAPYRIFGKRERKLSIFDAILISLLLISLFITAREHRRILPSSKSASKGTEFVGIDHNKGNIDGLVILSAADAPEPPRPEPEKTVAFPAHGMELDANLGTHIESIGTVEFDNRAGQDPDAPRPIQLPPPNAPVLVESLNSKEARRKASEEGIRRETNAMPGLSNSDQVQGDEQWAQSEGHAKLPTNLGHLSEHVANNSHYAAADLETDSAPPVMQHEANHQYAASDNSWDSNSDPKRDPVEIELLSGLGSSYVEGGTKYRPPLSGAEEMQDGHQITPEYDGSAEVSEDSMSRRPPGTHPSNEFTGEAGSSTSGTSEIVSVHETKSQPTTSSDTEPEGKSPSLRTSTWRPPYQPILDPKHIITVEELSQLFGILNANATLVHKSFLPMLEFYDIRNDTEFKNLAMRNALSIMHNRYVSLARHEMGVGLGSESSAVPSKVLYHVRHSGNVKKGYGLYAVEDIPPRTILGVYGGELIRYVDVTDGQYAWATPDFVVLDRRTGVWRNESFVLDATKVGNMLRFANDLGASTYNIEPIWVPVDNRWTLFYETTRTVFAGEELSISYGSEYWGDNTTTPNSTTEEARSGVFSEETSIKQHISPSASFEGQSREQGGHEDGDSVQRFKADDSASHHAGAPDESEMLDSELGEELRHDDSQPVPLRRMALRKVYLSSGYSDGNSLSKTNTDRPRFGREQLSRTTV